MFERRFQKRIEDFVCGNCRQEVKGYGYTNHCTACLWSKHVDNNPGDREALCGGLMEPVSIEIKSEEYVIVHQCNECGHEKKNKTDTGDNFNEILKISSTV